MEFYLHEVGITRGEIVLEFSYLVAAVCFIIGLKLLSHPETAKRGNLWAASGMLLAMVTTLLLHRDSSGANIGIVNIILIVITVGIGTLLGAIIARRDPID